MGKRTQSNIIRAALADRIVHGLLTPGEALDEASIASEFQVSRTPVREAIRQLEANGLARSRPHRGAVVTKLSDTQLDETFIVMAELEALCAFLSASAMTLSERNALTLIQEAGAASAKAQDLDTYRTHNEHFHNALYEGSHNAFLKETTVSVRQRLAPYRNLQFEAFHRPEVSHGEHQAIVSAILARDGQTASATMRDHILCVRRTVSTVTTRGRGAPRETLRTPRSGS